MNLQEPMNANERFLYAIAVRLDAIIAQNNSIIDALAQEKGLAVTSNKEVTKQEELVEVKAETKAPRKRTAKKVE